MQMTLEQAIQHGLERHNAGQLQQAEQVYRQILQHSPNQPETLHLLGVLAQQVGRPDVGADLIARAIVVNPNVALFHSNLSEALRKIGQLDRAVEAARKAIALEPNLSPAYTNLGAILSDMEQWEPAEAALRRSLELEPNSAMALSSLGNVLAKRGDLDGAIELAKQAINVDPNAAIPHNNLATSLETKELLAEAQAEYQRAVDIDPTFIHALNNLGSVIRRQGDLPTAMTHWRRATEVRPDFADAQWNLGLGCLSFGDFKQGWQLYEWRFRCSHSQRYYREYPVPHWNGSDLQGKTILLYPEQGFGDVIMFARFIPLLVESGARVILHLPPEMIDIMKGVAGVAEIYGPEQTLPHFDVHLPLLSLPSLLGTTLETLPRQVPYIQVDPAKREEWVQRASELPGKFKVGLVFAGRTLPDPKRTCRLVELAPLAEVPGVSLVSLQLGEAANQLADLPQMGVVDWSRHLANFTDTAAAISSLDLLITIDTAAAHVGGAIGAPTWTLIPFAPDFRWMLEREDSPWYPTMRLFRQTRRDEWSDVIIRLREALLAKAGGLV